MDTAVNLDLENKNQLGEYSINFIFLNLYPIVLEKRWTDGESGSNDFNEKVKGGEDLKVVKWVALIRFLLGMCYY